LPDAQEHLERARSIFITLKDKGMVAQVDDSRARVFIAQGHFTKAESLARYSVRTLADGDELSLLAEALTTHGTAFARLGNFSRARASLERAIRTAHDAGDPENGGIAALTLVEELSNYVPSSELVAYYQLAESELRTSQHPGVQNRLGTCARRILATNFLPSSDSQANVSPADSNSLGATSGNTKLAEAAEMASTASLEEQVLKFEGHLIKQALDSSDGSVTRASRALGISHQGLAFILNGRQKHLVTARKPVKRRRRSIIRYH
jgi:hypothetical protein